MARRPGEWLKASSEVLAEASDLQSCNVKCCNIPRTCMQILFGLKGEKGREDKIYEHLPTTILQISLWQNSQFCAKSSHRPGNFPPSRMFFPLRRSSSPLSGKEKNISNPGKRSRPKIRPMKKLTMHWVWELSHLMECDVSSKTLQLLQFMQ